MELNIRAGQELGEIKMVDLMQHDGLVDAFSNNSMGIIAENVARNFNITKGNARPIHLEVIEANEAFAAQTNLC